MDILCRKWIKLCTGNLHIKVEWQKGEGKNMVYRETFGPMNEQEITNIEIQFNVQFPTDYRMYLKEIGGGFAEWSESNGIYVEDVKDKVFIDEMFGNIDIDSARIDFWTKKYQDEMFEKSIIIGDSLEHGFFVLVCEGEDKGVYYWDDTYHFEISNDENNVYWLADSFTDFMNQIH